MEQAKWNDRDDLCKFIVSNGALVCILDYSREICCRCSLYKLSTTAPSFLRSKYFLYTLYTVYIRYTVYTVYCTLYNSYI